MTSYFRRIGDGPLGFILCLECDEWSAVGDQADLPQQFVAHVESHHPRCSAVEPELG